MPKKSAGVSQKKTVAQVEVQTAVAAVRDVKPKTVIDTIAALKMALPSELDKVSNEVLSLLETRDNLRVDIEESNKRLSEIHGIESAAVTKDELLAEIDSLREAWSLEKDALKVERDRENSDYIVELNRKYNRLEQELSDKIDAAKRAEKLRTETVATDFAKREAELAAREAELKDYKAKVDGFDATLKKEVDKAVAVATNAQKREYEHQTALTNKDREADKKLADATISALNSRISTLVSDNNNLQSKLDAAQRQVAEVAHKAVESASGRQALSAVQETLSQQNTGDSRRK